MSTTFVSPNRSIVGPGRLTVHLPARAIRRPTIRATYRRRRVGAVAFAVTLVMSVGSMAQRGLADRGGDPASVSTVGQHSSYLVRDGDTLWSIAQARYPSADVAEVVDALVSLNGGASIDVGQALLMP